MKHIIILLSLLVFSSGCSSARIRTKFTDPAHRIMVDPDSVGENSLVQIQTALVESNKFFVVDRARGFKAIQAEQARIHKDTADQFDDSEKYAMYGKLYSVGAVIVAHADCVKVPGIIAYVKRIDCHQNLSAVDTSTGQIISAVSYTAESESNYDMPGWDEIVEKFNKSFPKTWEPVDYDKEMTAFRSTASESAKKTRQDLSKNNPAQEE